MSFSIFRGGLMRSAAGSGLRLPTFDDGDGTGSKLLQWLFSPTGSFEVGDDGYTYVTDAANKGDDRPLRGGQAVDYDGVDGKFQVPYSESLVFSNGTVDQPFSISFWAYIDDTSTTGYILSDSSGSTTRNWLVWYTNSNLRFTLYDGATNITIQKNNNGVVPQQQWILITATYDGSGTAAGLSLEYYINGVPSGNSRTNVTSGSYVAMTASPLASLRSGLDASIFFDGRLADIRLHNTELTTTEIENLVANPTYLTGHEVLHLPSAEEAGATLFDVSGNGNHATLSGGYSRTTQNTISYSDVVGYSEGARSFNGSSDFIDTGVAFSPAGDYEVSGWFSTVSSATQYIFDGRDVFPDGVTLFLDTAGNVQYYHNATVLETTGSYNDGLFYRFVASKSGSALSLKIYNTDGTLAETERTGTDATAISTTAISFIGMNTTVGKLRFAGSIYNLKAIDNGTTIIDMKDDSGFTYTGTSEVIVPAKLGS
jgi:hypothetical protein